MGIVKSLGAITDDPRIGVPAEEYTRIRTAKRYYEGVDEKIDYMVLGQRKKRPKSKINLSKNASRRLASIIFNEKCSIKVNDASLQNILDEIFRDTRFYNTFETHLERNIALGSGAIRPYVEDDKIKLNWADGLGVYPLQANTTEVRELALARKTSKVINNETFYYTLLEFHQWQNKTVDDAGNSYYPYTITNELYESTDSNTIGTQVPLNTLDEYAELQQTATFTHLKYPLFAFYRNPGDNNKDFSSPLGLGLCDNCRDILEAINDVQDQFHREVKLGRRRVTIPRSWVRRQTQINGKPIPEQDQNYWDIDDDTFLPVNSGPNDSSAFKDLAVVIRADQYESSMSYFLRQFETQIGVSEGTFSATPTGIQTATGVVSSNSMTYQTRSSYLTQVEDTIDQLIYAIVELLQTPELWTNQQIQWEGDIEKLVITPDFADGVFVDQDAQFKNDLSAVSAGVLPQKEFIKRNYGLSDSEAQKWVQELQYEKATPAPDFEQFNPLKPNEDQNNADKDKSEVNGSGTKQNAEESGQDH